MKEHEISITRAFPSNTFQASDTAAGYLIPEVWSRKIEEFEKANLVFANLGVYNTELLESPGDIVNIAVDAELTAAALTESTTASVSAISYTQVTVTPSEYGVAVQVTRKNLKRAFNSIMEDQSRIMGYALAKKKDVVIEAALAGAAGSSSTIYAGTATATGALTSAMVLDTDLIANGISTLRGKDVPAKYLVIHPNTENSLLKEADFIDASKYGGREVVMNGEIGRYLGIQVFTTTVCSTAGSANIYYNYMLGPRAFVLAQKMTPKFDSKYEPLDRAYTLVAVEDYGVSVLNSKHIVKMISWKGI